MSSTEGCVNSPRAVSGSNGQTLRFGFDNSYARLPERFYRRLNPIPVLEPRLIKLNVALANQLGLDPDALATPDGFAILAGNRVAEGSEPLAIAYAGHQFGQFVPQLGDGRANLLGEVMGRDGVRYDIQLKGSGQTPFSRRGDGRAALGPVLREYIVSEAMAALGVPTTRALAAVTTGERVFREAVLPGAVLTRIAASHLRVGTFQYFAAQGDTDGLRQLAQYAIERHYPDLTKAERPYRALLDRVIARHASLVAQWMNLGFIHGVMNTDNTSISGETLDYGPCAFMEAYDPATVFSAIDQQGRYAYGNQPRIALWNLMRLAEALLHLLQHEQGSQEAALATANEALAEFPALYEAALLSGLRRKLGLLTEHDEDLTLAEDFLTLMTAQRADFTSTFRRLNDAATEAGRDAARELFHDPAAYDAWSARWHARLAAESTSAEARMAAMRLANPVYIPRNHLVEAAIQAAVDGQDYEPFEKLLEVVTEPYDEKPGLEEYARPARAEEQVSQTFCGT